MTLKVSASFLPTIRGSNNFWRSRTTFAYHSFNEVPNFKDSCHFLSFILAAVTSWSSNGKTSNIIRDFTDRTSQILYHVERLWQDVVKKEDSMVRFWVKQKQFPSKGVVRTAASYNGDVLKYQAAWGPLKDSTVIREQMEAKTYELLVPFLGKWLCRSCGVHKRCHNRMELLFIRPGFICDLVRFMRPAGTLPFHKRNESARYTNLSWWRGKWNIHSRVRVGCGKRRSAIGSGFVNYTGEKIPEPPSHMWISKTIMTLSSQDARWKAKISTEKQWLFLTATKVLQRVGEAAPRYTLRGKCYPEMWQNSREKIHQDCKIRIIPFGSRSARRALSTEWPA